MKFDYVVLLQPTSPLRNTKHIDEAINKAPYLADPYVALAKIRYQQGNLNDAHKLLKQAMDLERDHQQRSIYAAKLAAIRSHQ